MLLQPVDPPDHRGMIDPELSCGSRDRPAAHDCEHEAEVIPIDRVALIQHFRTSKVQYIGLESYKMQVNTLLSKRSGSPFGGNHARNRTFHRWQGGQGYLGTVGGRI